MEGSDLSSKPEEALYLNQYTKNWGERLTFTAGVGFYTGGVLGASFGGAIGWRKARKSRYAKFAHFRAKISNIALRSANGVAAACVLFVFVTKTIDLMFEEEIADWGSGFRHCVSGGVTGCIYKSTLGRRPMVVGSILGAFLSFFISGSINKLYNSGIIGFKADF